MLRRAADLAGVTYGRDHDADVRLRVVADHVRSGLMLIGDGVTPGNEGRGYILRRLLRRAVRSMKLLGVEDATLPELLPVSRDAMSASYPELATDFAPDLRRRLRRGGGVPPHPDAPGRRCSTPPSRRRRRRAPRRSPATRRSRLHDTYGFPIDVTLEMAAEQGVTVDEAGLPRAHEASSATAPAPTPAPSAPARSTSWPTGGCWPTTARPTGRPTTPCAPTRACSAS